VGKFQPSIKAGALFPQAARTSFVDITRSRYQGMVERMKKKKIPPPPFDLEQFRADVVGVMGGTEDGVIQCRYCLRWFTLQEIAVDHGTPLSRGGSAGLDNLDYPCAADNKRKGSLTVAEYQELLAFLNTKHPLMRANVLSRLERADALAAGARRAQMLSAKIQKMSQGREPENKRAPDADLGEF
jgi:hypothetical protein